MAVALLENATSPDTLIPGIPKFDVGWAYKLTTGFARQFAQLTIPISHSFNLFADVLTLGPTPMAHVYNNTVMGDKVITVLRHATTHILVFKTQDEARAAFRAARGLNQSMNGRSHVTIRLMYIGDPLVTEQVPVNDRLRGFTWNNLWDHYRAQGYTILQTVADGEHITMCGAIAPDTQATLYLLPDRPETDPATFQLTVATPTLLKAVQVPLCVDFQRGNDVMALDWENQVAFIAPNGQPTTVCIELKRNQSVGIVVTTLEQAQQVLAKVNHIGHNTHHLGGFVIVQVFYMAPGAAQTVSVDDPARGGMLNYLWAYLRAQDKQPLRTLVNGRRVYDCGPIHQDDTVRVDVLLAA